MLDFRTDSFLTVCECMNYTKAADILGLTQPAISGHIKYLEAYYGVKLFEYENKKLTITKQGEALKQALQTIKHDEIKLREQLQEIREKKIFRVGATLSISDAYLPRVLSSYISSHPDIELSVNVANTTTLLGKLDQGQLDLVLTEGYFQKDSYETRQIKNESLSIVCGKDYPIEKITSIDMLFPHRFISREPGSGTRAVFEHYLNDNGYSIDSFTNKCSITNLSLIKELLMDNQGISVLYQCVVKEMIEQNQLKEIKIPGFNLKHEFNAVWQKNSMFSFENHEFLQLL